MTTYELVIKTLFAFLICFSLSAQRTVLIGVLGTNTESGGSTPSTPTPRNWVDLATAVPSLDYLYIPDSSRNTESSSGDYVSNGDTVRWIDDIMGNTIVDFDGDNTVNCATQWANSAFYWNDPLRDSVPHWEIPNCLDCWRFQDNRTTTISALANMPAELYYVTMTERAALNERWTSQGYTIEETGGATMQGRWGSTSDKTLPVDGIPAENKIAIIRVQITPSGYYKMWINNDFKDSVFLGTTASATFWGIGSNTHIQKHRVYAMFGRWDSYFTTAERDSIYSIALSIVDTGIFPYYASTYNGEVSFNTSGNTFDISLDTVTRTGQPIDSIEAVLFVQNPGLAPAGNWIDDMMPVDTVKGPVSDMATILSFDGDLIPELSSGDGRYVYAWTRVRDESGYWGKWSQTAFYINGSTW